MLHILSYQKGEGISRPTSASLPELLADEGRITWIDFDAPTPEETGLLSTFFKFHPLAIEDCLAEIHDPKLDDYGEYLYLVFHGAQKDDVDGLITTREVDMFLGRNYLVTFHEEPSRSITAALSRCDRNETLLARDPERILHMILDAMVDNYLPIMDRIGEETEDLENRVFSEPSPALLGRIFTAKKNLLYLRRILYPQRDVVRKLGEGGPLICRDCALLFRDIHDHLYMLSSLIESHRDSMTGAMEAYLSVVSNRLNEVMKALTAFAVIIGTLTVISGIYGMNFEHMPGLHARYGFPVMMLFMAVIAVGMLWYFRRKKWLD